jgi:hypothetical protein
MLRNWLAEWKRIALGWRRSAAALEEGGAEN